MKHLEITLNINILPKIAQIEILDFYEFLKQKHEIAGGDYCQTDYSHAGLEAFLEKKINVKNIQKFTREELNERKCFY